jgi:hypothetical protein
LAGRTEKPGRKGLARGTFHTKTFKFNIHDPEKLKERVVIYLPNPSGVPHLIKELCGETRRFGIIKTTPFANIELRSFLFEEKTVIKKCNIQLFFSHFNDAFRS